MNIDASIREEDNVDKYLKMRLTSNQHKELRDLAFNSRIPVSTLGRKIIVKYLESVHLQ